MVRFVGEIEDGGDGGVENFGVRAVGFVGGRWRKGGDGGREEICRWGIVGV